MKKRGRRGTLLLLAAALAAVVGLTLDVTHALRGTESAAVDARFDIQGAPAPNANVVVVGIDEQSLRGSQWPFDRTRHATVIRNLANAGAKVIAYDVPFTAPGKTVKADEALFGAISAAHGVVLATDGVGPGGTVSLFGDAGALRASGAVAGERSLRADADGTVRHMPFRVAGLDSFAVAAARLQAGRELGIPSGSSAWIANPPNAPELSFDAVEQGRFPASAVRGKVVVVGVTAASLGGRHRTPAGDSAPDPAVQAAAIATALDGFPLQDGPGWLGALLAIALAALAPLVALRTRIWLGLVAGVAGVVVFLVAAQLAFDGGTVLRVVPPLGGAAAGLIATLLVLIPARAEQVDRLLDRIGGRRGNQRARRMRTMLLLGAVGSIVFVGLVAQATHVLRRADLSTVNMRFDVRGKKTPPPVVVVSIEDKTITSQGGTWPMKRTRHATVIRNLMKAGAKVIAYDVQFTEPSGDDAADNALIEAVRKAAPRVVLATTEVGTNGETNIFGGKGQDGGLPYSRAVPSNSNYKNDVDGRIRQMAFKIDKLETFGMAAARLALGHPIKTPGGIGAWIDYPGPAHTIPFISFDDVEKGKFDAAAVRGKLVVVGASAPSLQDLHPTSTTGSGLMPGPEIQAAAAGTALEGFPLRSGPGWLNTLLLVVLAALAPAVALRRGIGMAVGVAVVAIAALLAGAQIAFDHGTIITFVYAFAAGILGILAAAGIHGVTVAFEREQARDAFARFVPEAVVDQVLADADGVRLGGVRREGTVMFSDLRGFTSFSETLEPEQVIEALNKYLTEMSEAILDHGGTLVAYMGDGIMAVFGAPLRQPDHADRALEAARDMLSRMDGFNSYLREQGLHEGGFKMGIGLNSGPVMSGNVGSERRLEYTALGDTTNTAARLEGMTKGTPHQLYVSDSTRAMLTRPAEDLIQVGEAEVRGRVAKVLLWSLADQPPPPVDPGSPPKPVEAEA